jgi:hypothetical protein
MIRHANDSMGLTKQVGLGDNAFDLYLEGAYFESQLGRLLSWLRFLMAFLSPS